MLSVSINILNIPVRGIMNYRQWSCVSNHKDGLVRRLETERAARRRLVPGRLPQHDQPMRRGISTYKKGILLLITAGLSSSVHSIAISSLLRDFSGSIR